MKPSEWFLRLMGQQARKPSGLLGRMMGHGMAWGHRSLTAWALSHLDVQPTDRVLDIGCGSGMAIKLIAEITVDGFVTGIDYSQQMLRQARRSNAMPSKQVLAGCVRCANSQIVSLRWRSLAWLK